LKIDNAFLKARSISQASEESKRMAKRKLEYLKPFKPRPQTSSLVASKLIGASLGIRNMLPKEKVDLEKNKIKMAKGNQQNGRTENIRIENLAEIMIDSSVCLEKHRKEKDLKESIWNGET
jgi:hypothetical protein